MLRSRKKDGDEKLEVCSVKLFWKRTLCLLFHSTLLFVQQFDACVCVSIHNHHGMAAQRQNNKYGIACCNAESTESEFKKYGRHAVMCVVKTLVFPITSIIYFRLIRKRNPGKADNNHLHHHLIKKFSLTVTLFSYFLLVNIPILLALFTRINKLFILFFVILIFSALIIYLKKNVKKL